MQKQETKLYRITCKNKKPSFTGSHAKTRNQALQDHMQKQETKLYRITCKNKKPSFTGSHAKTRNQAYRITCKNKKPKRIEKLFTFANVRQKY